MLKNAMLVITAVLVAGVVTLASLNAYVVQDGAAGELLWNADEAYLFIDAYHVGWRMSYLQYCGAVIQEFFRVATPSKDKRSSVLVIHITPNNIQKYSAGDRHLNFYTPFEGNIYANNEGTLLRLFGSHFEPASSQEEQRFRNAKADVPPDFMDVNGWSKQLAVLNRSFDGGNEFPVKLGGKTLSILVTHGHDNADISVELVRPSQPTEQILHVDHRTRRVTKAEYEALFGKH